MRARQSAPGHGANKSSREAPELTQKERAKASQTVEWVQVQTIRSCLPAAAGALPTFPARRWNLPVCWSGSLCAGFQDSHPKPASLSIAVTIVRFSFRPLCTEQLLEARLILRFAMTQGPRRPRDTKVPLCQGLALQADPSTYRSRGGTADEWVPRRQGGSLMKEGHSSFFAARGLEGSNCLSRRHLPPHCVARGHPLLSLSSIGEATHSAQRRRLEPNPGTLRAGKHIDDVFRESEHQQNGISMPCNIISWVDLAIGSIHNSAAGPARFPFQVPRNFIQEPTIPSACHETPRQG